MGVGFLMNIILKMTKLWFEDIDTHKQVDLERKSCMVTMSVVPAEPQLVVPIQWDRGIKSASLLKLLITLHFG